MFSLNNLGLVQGEELEVYVLVPIGANRIQEKGISFDLPISGDCGHVRPIGDDNVRCLVSVPLDLPLGTSLLLQLTGGEVLTQPIDDVYIFSATDSLRVVGSCNLVKSSIHGHPVFSVPVKDLKNVEQVSPPGFKYPRVLAGIAILVLMIMFANIGKTKNPLPKRSQASDSIKTAFLYNQLDLVRKQGETLEADLALATCEADSQKVRVAASEQIIADLKRLSDTKDRQHKQKMGVMIRLSKSTVHPNDSIFVALSDTTRRFMGIGKAGVASVVACLRDTAFVNKARPYMKPKLNNPVSEGLSARN